MLDSLNEARIFDGRLSYDKGAGIIHTLRYLINNDNLFFAALQDFQNAFANSTATGLDFKNHMANYCNIDLDAFFEEWYFGEGYPTYHVNYNQVGTDLYIQITQTTSMPSVTPTFTTPLTLKLPRQIQPDTTIRFEITGNDCQYVVHNFGQMNGTIGIDPSNWIINGNAGVSMDPTLGLSSQPIDLKPALTIFPNPSADFIQILNQKEVFSYELYAANGQLIKKGTIAPGEQIGLENLKKGAYILQLKGSERFKCTKLVTIN